MGRATHHGIHLTLAYLLWFASRGGGSLHCSNGRARAVPIEAASTPKHQWTQCAASSRPDRLRASLGPSDWSAAKDHDRRGGEGPEQSGRDERPVFEHVGGRVAALAAAVDEVEEAEEA